MAATPSLGLTLGAIEIGVLLSSVLWGVTCVQVYIYSMNSGRDSTALKSLVTAIFAMESLHMILTWVYFYNMTVTRFGDVEAIAEVPWTFNVAFFMHTSVSAIVQGFFSYRVWKLSSKVWLAIAPWFVALCRFCFSLAAIVLLAMDGIAAFTSHRYLGDLALVLSMVVDIYNAMLLIYYLSRAKDRVMINTYRTINSILALTMETGFVIMLVAIFGLISWIVAPESALWIGAIIVYARLYSNSLLASLNARQMRKLHSSANSGRIPSSGIFVERTIELESESTKNDMPKIQDRESYGLHPIATTGMKNNVSLS